MELRLQREKSNTECTFGKLYIDGEEFCQTLEDPVRVRKIWGRTAIPAGRYRIRITKSARFKTLLPILVNVPNFIGVRIHAGNWASDTEGCILVGMERDESENMVKMSKAALSKLLIRISKAIDAHQEVWLTIHNA
jgi:hypothetical protein